VNAVKPRFTNAQIALAALGVSAVAGIVWFLGRPQHYYLWQPPPGFVVQRPSPGISAPTTIFDQSGNLFATVDSSGYLVDSSGHRMTHTAAGVTVPVRLAG